MLDKLELGIPPATPLRPPFAEIVCERSRGRWMPGVSSSLHYRYIFDLRPYGAEAILHHGSKHDRNRPDKLELLESGDKRFDVLVQEIGSIFDIDPNELVVKRIDLAVDVDGIPVTWFRHHSRVPYKQFSREVGKITVEFSEAVKGEVQTLYFGRSPNCYRIYNKVAECAAQYLKEYGAVIRPYIGRGRNVSEILGFAGLDLTFYRGGGTHMTIPSFQSRYGFTPDAVRTRIERQIGGGRVPPQLDRVWKLRRSLPEFNPFEQLRFLAAPLEPDWCSLGARDFLLVKGLRQLIAECGHQRARQEINSRSCRNANRFFDRYGEFLQVDPSDGFGLTEPELFELYKNSITRQLGTNVAAVSVQQESLL